MKPVFLVVFSFLLSACGSVQNPIIIAHRATGLGAKGENQVSNVAPLMSAGFGVEIDIRADGDLQFELGHFAPQGGTLLEVLDALKADWEPGFEGKVLVIDVVNDQSDLISSKLMTFLDEQVSGTELEDLAFIVQSSSLQSLIRLRATRGADSALDIRMALTYFAVQDYTVSECDLVTTPAAELGDFRYPLRLFSSAWIHGRPTGKRCALTPRSMRS